MDMTFEEWRHSIETLLLAFLNRFEDTIRNIPTRSPKLQEELERIRSGIADLQQRVQEMRNVSSLADANMDNLRKEFRELKSRVEVLGVVPDFADMLKPLTALLERFTALHDEITKSRSAADAAQVESLVVRVGNLEQKVQPLEALPERVNLHGEKIKILEGKDSPTPKEEVKKTRLKMWVERNQLWFLPALVSALVTLFILFLWSLTPYPQQTGQVPSGAQYSQLIRPQAPASRDVTPSANGIVSLQKQVAELQKQVSDIVVRVKRLQESNVGLRTGMGNLATIAAGRLTQLQSRIAALQEQIVALQHDAALWSGCQPNTDLRIGCQRQ